MTPIRKRGGLGDHEKVGEKPFVVEGDANTGASSNAGIRGGVKSGRGKSEAKDSDTVKEQEETIGGQTDKSISSALDASIEALLKEEEAAVKQDLTGAGGVVNQAADNLDTAATLRALKRPTMKIMRRYGEEYIRAALRNILDKQADERKMNRELPLDDAVDGLYSISLNRLRSASGSGPDRKPFEDISPDAEKEGNIDDEDGNSVRSLAAEKATEEEEENRIDEKNSKPPVQPRLRSDAIHHFNTALLNGYVNAKGRILSRRETGLSPKDQRRLAKAVKRARAFGLMSPVEQLEFEDITAVFTRRMKTPKKKKE